MGEERQVLIEGTYVTIPTSVPIVRKGNMAYTEIDRKLIVGVLQNTPGIPQEAVAKVESTLEPMQVSLVLNELLQNGKITGLTFNTLQTILMGVDFDLDEVE